jgi:hypothetical protein
VPVSPAPSQPLEPSFGNPSPSDCNPLETREKEPLMQQACENTLRNDLEKTKDGRWNSCTTVTVFLRPLSPCDLVQAEFQLAACATSFRPSPLRHKRHGAKWAPNIRCSDHPGCCVARTFHLPSFVFSRSLRSVFSHACRINGSFLLFQVGCNPTDPDRRRRVLEAVREQDRRAQMPVWVR